MVVVELMLELELVLALELELVVVGHRHGCRGARVSCRSSGGIVECSDHGCALSRTTGA